MDHYVEQFLADTHATYRLHEHEAITTATEGKALRSFPVSALVKCLAFAIADHRFVLVALRADDRADYKKIAATLHISRQQLRAATEDEITGSLHMLPGGVGPFPFGGATVVIDAAVQAIPTVYCGTGSRHTTLEIGAEELIRISAAIIADVAKTG